jgi:hypothetical protein
MLHAHAPCVGPHFFENIDHAGGSERNPLLGNVTKRIVTVRLLRIGCIEINYSVPLRCRNACCDARNKIAMRIDQRETISAFQILERHCFK